MRTRSFVVIASLAFAALSAGVTGTLRAQQPAQPAAAPPPSPAACTAPEHRQFDFWIGDWDVANAAGAIVGRNEITREFNGCVIRERWNVRTPRGGGESLNGYDAVTKRWHQTWMDAQGNVAQIEGGMQGTSMVLVRTARSPQDSTVMLIHRWTWTPIDADHLRQQWETSADGGATWRTSFDGYYTRRK